MMSCEQHDYIEIACLYKYPITLTLTSGAEIAGIALDTQRNDNREECIKLRVDDAERLVVLASVARMEAGTDNPHFRAVDFD
ncbi:Rho-binding antiterminator [Zobellella maritima]|uniref:Rho-binding antiterminator n=1 Tax=Zobellella maritima TaxID=2059725 RepID=UPI000E3031B8|nr:Rho-binding antiterminator [Zobellella maritima]